MKSKNRNRAISIAESVVAADKKDGTLYNPSSLVDIWNSKFNFVESEQLPALKNQVELEVAAIRGAEAANFDISTRSYVNFQAARVFNAHMPTEPDPSKI